MDAAEAKTRDLTERGHAIVAKARQAQAEAAGYARRAVVEADAAEERRRVAERTARQEAAGIVAEAERQAERLRSIGSRVGGLWSGFTGLQRRLEVHADERVAAVEEQTRLAVRATKSRVEQAVGNELAQAQREIAAARARADVAERQAVEARAARAAAEGEAQRERSGREQAERERDRFRGMWADADNRLQARRSYRD